MSNHRNNPRPAPLHYLDNALVASMYAEIRALYGLLLDAADSMGISPEQTEKAIDHRIQEAKGGPGVR